MLSSRKWFRRSESGQCDYATKIFRNLRRNNWQSCAGRRRLDDFLSKNGWIFSIFFVCTSNYGNFIQKNIMMWIHTNTRSCALRSIDAWFWKCFDFHCNGSSILRCANLNIENFLLCCIMHNLRWPQYTALNWWVYICVRGRFACVTRAAIQCVCIWVSLWWE